MIKAWKALLSGAVVTEGEALGKRILYGCLEDSTSYGVNVGMHKYQGTAITSLRSVGPRTSLQAVIPATLVPRASPSVTNASLSTAFQAERWLHHTGLDRVLGDDLQAGRWLHHTGLGSLLSKSSDLMQQNNCWRFVLGPTDRGDIGSTSIKKTSTRLYINKKYTSTRIIL